MTNCTRLETLPTSICSQSAVRLLKISLNILFVNPLNLIRNAMTSELQPSFLRAATEYFRSRHEELGKSKYPRISFCLEGNSISKWFNHQSKRSSIELQFSPDWHDTNILGFVVQLNVGCAYHFTTNREDSTVRKHNWDFSLRQTTFDYPSWIFVWYLYKDCDDYDQDATRASFQFHVEQISQNSYFDWSPRITNCGLHILYLQDLEEFGDNKLHGQG